MPTITYNGTLLVGSIDSARRLLWLMHYARKKWEDEGKPYSGALT